ncbi:hypothetical protein Tco_0597321 [Tanacetum coccineum]
MTRRSLYHMVPGRFDQSLEARLSQSACNIESESVCTWLLCLNEDTLIAVAVSACAWYKSCVFPLHGAQHVLRLLVVTSPTVIGAISWNCLCRILPRLSLNSRLAVELLRSHICEHICGQSNLFVGRAAQTREYYPLRSQVDGMDRDCGSGAMKVVVEHAPRQGVPCQEGGDSEIGVMVMELSWPEVSSTIL